MKKSQYFFSIGIFLHRILYFNFRLAYTSSPKLKKENIQNDYKLVKLLGSGVYGKVFLAKRISDNKEVVVKSIEDLTTNGPSPSCESEFINLLKCQNHENIIHIEDPNLYFYNGHYFFVLEVADITLANYLDEKINIGILLPKILEFLRSIFSAIKHIHDNNVIHMDLHLSNIMLKNEQIKITDFGLSLDTNLDYMKTWESWEIVFENDMNTYVAPEIVRKEKFDKSIDIYSFGWSLNIIIQYIPILFKNNEEKQQVMKLINDMVDKTCNKEKNKRLKDQECLEHPLLSILYPNFGKIESLENLEKTKILNKLIEKKDKVLTIQTEANEIKLTDKTYIPINPKDQKDQYTITIDGTEIDIGNIKYEILEVINSAVEYIINLSPSKEKNTLPDLSVSGVSYANPSFIGSIILTIIFASSGTYFFHKARKL